jgi:hypothetical protein
MKRVYVYVYVLWIVERSFERCSSDNYTSALLLRRTTLLQRRTLLWCAQCVSLPLQSSLQQCTHCADAIMQDLSVQQVMRATTLNATVKHSTKLLLQLSFANFKSH